MMLGRVQSSSGIHFFMTVGILLGAESAVAECLSLEAAVQASRARSEAIKIAAAQVDEAEAQLKSARAAVLPVLALSGAALQQDVPSTSASSVQSPNSLQTGAKLVLSQPLFKGGQEYALLRSAKAQVAAAEAKLDDAKVRLAGEAAAAYFDARLAAAEVDALKELTKVSERRFADIKKRAAIGRSRAADLLGAEAQAQSAKAQLEAAQVVYDSAAIKLASIAGVATPESLPEICKSGDRSGVKADLVNHFAAMSWPEVERRVLQRADLDVARIARDIAAEGVTVARSGHLPSIDLSGNYYLKRGDSRFANGNWDMSINATLPIFSGGSVRAAVQQAKSREVQQDELLRLKQREAIMDARDLWRRLASSKSQLKLLQSSAAKSDSYYRRVAKDERMGLGSSLETLQALNAAIDARRALERFAIQNQSTAFKLRLATGAER